MSRGGKRKGAGRKPAPKRVAITVRITPEAAQRFKAYAYAAGASQSEVVQSMAMRLPTTFYSPM